MAAATAWRSRTSASAGVGPRPLFRRSPLPPLRDEYDFVLAFLASAMLGASARNMAWMSPFWNACWVAWPPETQMKRSVWMQTGPPQ